MSRLDYLQKIRIAGAGFVLCLLSVPPIFLTELPVYLIALPIIVFELGSWHMFVRLRDEYEPFRPFKLPWALGSFAIYHITFYAVVILFNAFVHKDPISETIATVAFVALIISAILANSLDYWPNDRNSDDDSISKTRPLRIFLTFLRLPLGLLEVVLSVDIGVRILSYMFDVSAGIVSSLNTSQLLGILVLVSALYGFIYGLGTNSRHIDTVGRRVSYATVTAVRSPIIVLITTVFMVLLVYSHIYLVGLSYSLEPVFYWPALWIIDCLIPLTIYMFSEYSSKEDYPFVDGSVAIGATPQWWAAGYLGISAGALLVSSLLSDHSQFPIGVWGLLVGGAFTYFGLIAFYTQMLEHRSWTWEL